MNLRHACRGMVCAGMAAPWGFALEADVRTSRGTFTIVLDAGSAPLATANFVRLAEGGSFWRDADRGLLTDGPCYDGRSVGPVVSNAEERFFEVGDGRIPGYEFEDEISPGSGHVPYAVTMATQAPNTNGAAIRVFGAMADDSRNGRHTVFGQVQAGGGRGVVDAIIQGGAGDTVIESVVIRNKAASLAVLQSAWQELPSLHPATGLLEVDSGVSTFFWTHQPASSVLVVNSSTDLQAWQPLGSRFIDAAGTASPGWVLDAAELPRKFYRAALALYPGEAPGIDSLGGSVIEIRGAGIATLIYHFNAEGTGGTFQNVVSTAPPPLVFSGAFTVDPLQSVRLMPHSVQLRVRTQGLGGAEFQVIRIGWDSSLPSGAEGRHVTALLNSAGGLIFEDSGAAILSVN